MPFASPPKAHQLVLNLTVSERSYGIEFWPFPGQNFSLGDAITRLGRSVYRDTKNLGDQSIKPCKRVAF